VTAPDELIRRTNEIKETHPHYWRDDQAQAELAAIWGEAVNAQGVFVDSPDEVLYDRDGYRVTITIGAANGLFAFGCGFRSPTQGYGSAPSIWDDLFGSHGEARTAAIEFLLKQLPQPLYPHEEGQRSQLDRMRQSVTDLLRQPSLF
jgi:hypothetical protein